MTNVTIFGGTGYAGSYIAREAVKRGHAVVSYSRKPPDEPINGVRYVTGTILSDADRRAALDGAGVVVVALSPRGDMATQMRAGVAALAEDVAGAGVRLGVVGGAGSLLVADGGPQLVSTPDFPAEVRDEAITMGEILEDLRGTPDELDWFFISPPANFGSFVSVESRGRYRVGGDVLLVDENGQSEISGEDFAVAFVDEIEQPKHHRTRFTVGY
jgi:uncharacterized protein